MKNRQLVDFSKVFIIVVILLILSISTSLLDGFYSFFETYTSLPIAEFLINIVLLSLASFLWLSYRRWREATKKQAELQDIIDSIIPDTLIVINPDRTIKICNSSVKKMFGYQVDEVINQKTSLLYFDRRSNPSQKNEIYDKLEMIGFHKGLARGKKKSGDIIHLEIITAKLIGCEGVVSLLKDISKRIKIEQEVMQQALFIKNNPNPVLQAEYNGNIFGYKYSLIFAVAMAIVSICIIYAKIWKLDRPAYREFKRKEAEAAKAIALASPVAAAQGASILLPRSVSRPPPSIRLTVHVVGKPIRPQIKDYEKENVEFKIEREDIGEKIEDEEEWEEKEGETWEEEEEPEGEEVIGWDEGYVEWVDYDEEV